MKYSPHRRSGFTLMELLITLGIISVLFALAARAINPTKQLHDAKNANRTAEIVELEHAVLQYIIDDHALIGIPTQKAKAKDVCQGTVSAEDCTDPLINGYDLSFLAPVYLAEIPVDPDETTETFSGYRIYYSGTIIKVCSPRRASECGT